VRAAGLALWSSGLTTYVAEQVEWNIDAPATALRVGHAKQLSAPARHKFRFVTIIVFVITPCS
jgi:hypothetical protein